MMQVLYIYVDMKTHSVVTKLWAGQLSNCLPSGSGKIIIPDPKCKGQLWGLSSLLIWHQALFSWW